MILYYEFGYECEVFIYFVAGHRAIARCPVMIIGDLILKESSFR